MNTNDPNRQGNCPPSLSNEQQQQQQQQHEKKKCHGNRRDQRFRRKCRARTMKPAEIEKLLKKRKQTNTKSNNHPTTARLSQGSVPQTTTTTTTTMISTNLNKRKRDISVQELQSISTLPKSTSSNSIEQQQPVRKKIKKKKKLDSLPSIKVTQTFIDRNYRRPIYLKRSLSLILQLLTNKLNYKFKKEKEQKFIYQRLSVLDQQCCLKEDQQLWQSYLDIGLLHQIWPNQLHKMAKTKKSELCQKYLVNYLEKIKKQFNQYQLELTKQSQSYPITTLPLNQLDPCLQEYVDCQRKYLSIRNQKQFIKFKDQIEQKKLFKMITTTSITKNQNELIHRLITIRQHQGAIWKESLILEMRILCKFLPLNFNYLEHFIGSIPYLPLNDNQKSIQIRNQRDKLIQEAKRTWLDIYSNAYIIKIQADDQQYQNKFRQLKSEIMNNNNNNHSNLWNKIKDYLTGQTNKLYVEIYNQISSYRMILVQNRQRSVATKTMIDVSPKLYLDLLSNPLNTCQQNHLALGSSHIRSNQSATFSRIQQEKEIDKLFKEISKKVTDHLTQPPYQIPRTNLILKQYFIQLRQYLNHTYFTPLSYKDQTQAQEQAHTIASIRKIIKQQKLILRQVDKGSTFYLGPASEFEKKVQKYFNETNAFMELSYNPFNETLEEVIALLNRLCLEKLISTKQHEQMMPKRSEVELAHLYFNPKIHKEGIPVRPIENTIHAITKKISDYLHKIIAPIFNEKCHETIIVDGAHLIKELQTYQKKGLLKPLTLFCTFDIHNLYTMLPQDEAIDILGEFLETHGTTNVDKIDITTLKELASIVLKENVFVYGNKFYRQTLGGAMGSSFTLTLANIFMWKWQKQFVRQKKISGEYFGRYIDDVFMTWNRSEKELIKLLIDANTWHPNIKLDCKISKSLPFLDVLLTNNNGLLSTCVYHKPTTEPYVLPFISDHARHVFGNIIQTSLTRAVGYSSNFPAFQKEQRSIRLMLLYNGYPSSFIDKQFRKFATEYLSKSSFLPLIDNETQYFLLRNKLIGQPTAQQSQVAISNTSTANIDFGQLASEESITTIESNKKSNNKTKKPYKTKLVFHYTHEQRFQSFKRDMHKIYNDTFKNSPAMEAKLIVGNRNRQMAKHELIRKKPRRTILQNKPLENKPRKLKQRT